MGGLVSRWQIRVYAYILAIVGDREEAWDVSQEVWIAVVSSLRKKADVRAFAPWLYGIAHNKSISHLRRKGRMEAREDGLASEVEDPPAPAQSTDESILAAEDASVIRDCLSRLPLAQRGTLTLFYLDELTLDEIARITEAPVGTVQSRLHYGRMKLKELLTKKGYGDGK